MRSILRPRECSLFPSRVLLPILQLHRVLEREIDREIIRRDAYRVPRVLRDREVECAEVEKYHRSRRT